jgi:hypothetical protein
MNDLLLLTAWQWRDILKTFHSLPGVLIVVVVQPGFGQHPFDGLGVNAFNENCA